MSLEPTNEEAELIKKFKTKLDDVLMTEEQKSDAFLVRWIRARESNLTAAEDILRKHLTWRVDLKVDTCLTKPFDPWFEVNFPYWVDMTDKQGNVVMYIPYGSWDVRRAMNNDKEVLFETFISRFFEHILEGLRKVNAELEGNGEWPRRLWFPIVDFKNYSYGQLAHWKAITNTLKMASTFEAHYPEILVKCYFINCPSFFPFFFSMLKRVMAPKTIGKMTIFSGKREEWVAKLLEEIDEDQLPSILGGKKVLHIGDKVYSPEK